MAFGVFVCVHARVQGETPARQTCYVACRLCLPLLLMFRLYLFKYFELISSGRAESGGTKDTQGQLGLPHCAHTHAHTCAHSPANHDSFSGATNNAFLASPSGEFLSEKANMCVRISCCPHCSVVTAQLTSPALVTHPGDRFWFPTVALRAPFLDGAQCVCPLS